MPARAGVSGAAVPSVKRQLDGDFLLYGCAGVATEPCRSHRVSQFDKWGEIMKTARWKLKGDDSSPLQQVDLSCRERRCKAMSIFQLYWSLPPTEASYSLNCAAPPPCLSAGGISQPVRLRRASGPWLSARGVALPEHTAIIDHTAT